MYLAFTSRIDNSGVNTSYLNTFFGDFFLSLGKQYEIDFCLLTDFISYMDGN